VTTTYSDYYSNYYDLLYSEKDYQRECDFIENIFHNFATRPIKTILDSGCGVGGHSLILASRGYSVTGVDMSEVMIAQAKEKSKGIANDVKWYIEDIRSFNLEAKFDAALCMFAVLNFLPRTIDILNAMKSIRKHLRKNSLFIFDSWNGFAVLHMRPSARSKTVEKGNIKIVRTADSHLDIYEHICKVSYHMIVTKSNRVIDEFDEFVPIRFLFPQEIIHYLNDSGFETLKICPFLDLSGKVDENVWNITVIAKAI